MIGKVVLAVQTSGFSREEFIKTKMTEHWEYLQSTDYEVVALFLQGSQNYGTDIYTDWYMSDVDTKAIVIPTLDNIVNGSAPLSHTHVMPDNSHIDIKDIRVMVEMWEKQNVSYIELLYTDYYIVNPLYELFVRELRNMRDSISAMHKNQFLRCIQGMSGNKVKALEHRYEGLIEKIDKYGYDSKQLLHIVRLHDFTQQWLTGTPVKDCYTPKPETLDIIRDIREYKYSLEDARNISTTFDTDTNVLIKHYIAAHIPDVVDNTTKIELHKLKVAMIRFSLKKELLEG